MAFLNTTTKSNPFSNSCQSLHGVTSLNPRLKLRLIPRPKPRPNIPCEYISTYTHGGHTCPQSHSQWLVMQWLPQTLLQHSTPVTHTRIVLIHAVQQVCTSLHTSHSDNNTDVPHAATHGTKARSSLCSVRLTFVHCDHQNTIWRDCKMIDILSALKGEGGGLVAAVRDTGVQESCVIHIYTIVCRM